MMWLSAVFLLIVALQKSHGAKVPQPAALCGFIVDNVVVKECMDCFADAGPLTQNPESFRRCVGIYLPPLLADCSVPHAEVGNRSLAETRIGVFKPSFHDTHLNANLLPACLTRRSRELRRYLQGEKVFAQEAGKMLKAVVKSSLVHKGGAAMLSVQAYRDILDTPLIQTFPNGVSREQHVKKGNNARRSTCSGEGNSLPLGGTGSIAQALVDGQAAVDNMISEGSGLSLVQLLNQEDYYNPVPPMMAKALLTFYKSYREQLQL